MEVPGVHGEQPALPVIPFPQDTGNHEYGGLDMSYLGDAFLPVDNSGLVTPRFTTGSSHDDSCVTDCVGVGLYSGPAAAYQHHRSTQQFAFHTRNRHSVAHPGYPSLALDLDAAYSAASFNHPFLFPPSSSGRDALTSAIVHQLPDGFASTVDWNAPALSPQVSRKVDDDKLSTGRRSSVCCGSQCGPAEPCTGSSCATEASACFDANCPVITPAVTSEVVDAAAALTSIGGNLEQQSAYLPLMPSGDFGGQQFSDAELGTAFDIDAKILQSTLDSLKEHILDEHAGDGSSSCVRPCLIDNPIYFSACHFEQPSFGAFPSNAFTTDTAANVGPLQLHEADGIHHHSYDCGVRIKDGDAFISHFNREHRPVIASATTVHGLPELPAATPQVLSPYDTNASSSSACTPGVRSLEDSLSASTNNTPTTLSTPGDGDISAAYLQMDNSPAAHEEDAENCCMWRDNAAAPVCGVVFGSSQELFDHVANAHIKTLVKGAGGFRCGWKGCRRADPDAEGFPQRSKIERHMQTHAAHKPYTCDICQRKFSAKQALDQHVLIHKGERPLACDWPGCTATFRQNSALTMHKRTHTGEKPLMCEVCGKCFSESSNLSKHRRTHETKGRFICTYPGCSRDFHRQDQLRRHLKQHQGERVPDQEFSSFEDDAIQDALRPSSQRSTASSLARLPRHESKAQDFPIRKRTTGIKKR